MEKILKQTTNGSIRANFIEFFISKNQLHNFHETCAKATLANANKELALQNTIKKVPSLSPDEQSFTTALTNFKPTQPLSFTPISPESIDFQKKKNSASVEVSNYNNNPEFEWLIKKTMPWRKGPFWYGNFKIDSEWQSDAKWQTISSTVLQYFQKNPQNFHVLDVGCNNGYFLFQIAQQITHTFLNPPKKNTKHISIETSKESSKKRNVSNNYNAGKSSKKLNKIPNSLIGIDPTWRYLQQFNILQKIFEWQNSKPQKKSENIKNGEKDESPAQTFCLPLGFQHLNFFKAEFNLVLCMGIIYHHQNPLEIISSVYKVVKKGGIAIFECIGAGDDESNPLLFFPKKTYLNKKGFWFLPNVKALIAMLTRTGFKCTLLESKRLTTKEQRSSMHAPYASLSEGLKNKTTIEGYPLPTRHYVLAGKP